MLGDVWCLPVQLSTALYFLAKHCLFVSNVSTLKAILHVVLPEYVNGFELGKSLQQVPMTDFFFVADLQSDLSLAPFCF